jgi:hypothetical protein
MGPDWSEESLQSHIEIAHPHLTSSEGVVQLLWRSFHFYAYHPFSQNSIGGRIDWKAFQRAVAMLAAQGADLLGVKEEIESYWRFDGENLYDQAKLKRIFRSIGTPEKSTELSDESRHILEEATDVLAMTQPFFMHNGPHEHQLTPTAQRLLGEDLIGTRRRVTQKDLKMLLNILIRLSLFKENWGLSFPFGGFGPTEPGADGLANILASELKGGQRQEYLGFNRVNQIKHLLVSFPCSPSFLKRLSRLLIITAELVHSVLSDVGRSFPARYDEQFRCSCSRVKSYTRTGPWFSLIVHSPFGSLYS